MIQRFTWCAGLLIGSAAFAADTTLDLTLQWTDPFGTTHVLKTIDFDLYNDAPPGGPIKLNGGDPLVTDGNGFKSFTTDQDEGEPSVDFYGIVFTEIDGIAMFETNSASSSPASREIPSTSTVWPIDTGNTEARSHIFTNADATEKTYGVLQAVKFMHDYYDAAPFNANLPAIEIAYAASSSLGKNQMLLGNDDWGSWDVIFHEYGHHVAEHNNLDWRDGNGDGLGLAHSFNADNITPHGATDGSRLAWQEGIATYLGIVAAIDGNLNGSIPGIQTDAYDTLYTDFRPAANDPTLDAGDRQFAVDIETRGMIVSNTANTTQNEGGGGYTTLKVRGQGEGDELSVARVLMDVYDTGPHNGAYSEPDARGSDSASWGAENTFNLMKDNDTFYDFWRDLAADAVTAGGKGRLNLTAGAADAEALAELGFIPEEYAISSIPLTDGLVDTTPTIEFTEQNSGHSAYYRLLVYEDDWSGLVFDSTRQFISGVAGDTLSIDVTDPLTNGDYKYVVLNDPKLSTIGELDSSLLNWYWSGWESITVIPEPGQGVLVIVGVGMWLRRRPVAA